MLTLERLSRTRTAASKAARTNTYVVVAVVLSAVLFLVLRQALKIPAEACLNLQCGLLIAQGKVPYLDFFEVASPALMYFCAIPAVLSRMFSFVHPIVIFNLFVLALAFGSCFLSAEILFRQRIREQTHVPLFIIAFALMNLFAIGEFGQREHLFLLLYMPFFLTRWLSWNNQASGDRLALAAGLCGGISICLDPLFVLLAVAMEFFFLLSKLKLSPFKTLELKVAGAVFLIFLSHFAFVPRQYANLYINWALPMVLCDYDIFDDRLWWVGKTPDRRDLVYFMMVSCVVALGLRRWSSLIPPVIAIAISGFGLFIIQGKSMTYQMLPMMYGAVLALALCVSVSWHAILKWERCQLKFDLKPFMVALLTLVPVGGYVFLSIRLAPGETFDLAKCGYIGSTCWTESSTFASNLESNTAVADKVLILNDRVRPAYPLLIQFNRQPATYLLTGFPMRMSKILKENASEEKKNQYAGLEFEMYERFIRDLKAVKPKFMMIEKDSLGEVLADHLVMKTINELYDEVGYSEWPDSDVEPVFDYYAFRTALVLYKLKGIDKPLDAPKN